MEELIATVGDKDVANYLREALSCYGTGAYRACIVLTHIALFDGLRRKIKALAPVNSVAKSVSDEIEPLATAQKVFELPLIQKLKGAGIFTQLEAQLLEQLNNQRNKSAHPSGHVVTAEEACFVFSEAIQKFLSQPIRETSYVVDRIIGKIADKNFFPSALLNDMEAVVDQEIANLDAVAKPFLITKLVQAREGGDATAAENASNFLLVLASKRDPSLRSLIVAKLIDPKASIHKNAEFFSALITCDPAILSLLEPGTKLRIKALLLINFAALGVSLSYQQLRNPVRVLGACLEVVGEEFMRTEMQDFTNAILAKAPCSPEFVAAASGSPILFASLWDCYLKNAASSQFAISKRIAEAAPAMDKPLSVAITDEQAFWFLAAIVCGAEAGGFAPKALCNDNFNDLPEIKAKALEFAETSASPAATILGAQDLKIELSDFIAKYLA
jgi:hypothetical protein